MADGARGQGAQRGMQNGSNRQRLFLLMRRGHWAGLSWSLAEPADVWLPWSRTQASGAMSDRTLLLPVFEYYNSSL